MTDIVNIQTSVRITPCSPRLQLQTLWTAVTMTKKMTFSYSYNWEWCPEHPNSCQDDLLSSQTPTSDFVNGGTCQAQVQVPIPHTNSPQSLLDYTVISWDWDYISIPISISISIAIPILIPIPSPTHWNFSACRNRTGMPYVLSAKSCFLIGNGKCKQLTDWSELELITVSDSCALRNLSVCKK